MKSESYQEIKKAIRAYAKFASLWNQDSNILFNVDGSLKCMDQYSWKMDNLGKPWRYAFFISKNKTAKIVFDGSEYELTFV